MEKIIESYIGLYKTSNILAIVRNEASSQNNNYIIIGLIALVLILVLITVFTNKKK